MIKRILLALALLGMLLPRTGMGENLFVRRAVTDPDWGQIPYWVYAPAQADERTPVILFLHGSGEKGDGALRLGLPAFLNEKQVPDLQAVLVVPQLSEDCYRWHLIDRALMKILDQTLNEFGGDTENVALTGFSLGGIGVWDVAALHPGRFRKVLCAAGKVNEDVPLNVFEHCAVRVYVGSSDQSVPMESARQFTLRLINAGYNAELQVLPAVHIDLVEVFRDPEVIAWLCDTE